MVDVTGPKEVLARMRVPGDTGLFELGCFERPATLYMQQIQVLNESPFLAGYILILSMQGRRQ